MGIEIDESGINIDAKTKEGNLFNLYGDIDDWGVNLSLGIGDFGVDLNDGYMWLAFRGFITGDLTEGTFTDYHGNSFVINNDTIQITNPVFDEVESSEIVNKNDLTHEYWCAADEDRLHYLFKHIISSCDDLHYGKVLTDEEYLIKFEEAKETRKRRDIIKQENEYFSEERLLKRHKISDLKNNKHDENLDNLLKDNLNRLYWLGGDIEIQDIKVWKHELPAMLDFLFGIKEHNVTDDYSIFGFIIQNEETWLVEYPPGEYVLPIKKLNAENVEHIKSSLTN